MFDIAHHGSGRLHFRLNSDDFDYSPSYPDNPVVEEYGLAPNALVTQKIQASEQNARGAYGFWLSLMNAENWDGLREKGQWP